MSFALESIDEVAGTAHLRANLHMPQVPLLGLIDESLKTDEMRRNSIPTQVLFGPFKINEGYIMNEYPPGMMRRRHPKPSSDFSESPPTSTEADIMIYGDPWFYPFDRYYLEATVRCFVLVTPDLKDYFLIRGDELSLSSKVPPNLVVRTATKEDLEHISKTWLSENIKLLAPNVWRDGGIELTLERPLFLRFFAAFFGIFALAWIVRIALTSDSKQIALNVLAYFLAIWAVRAPLAAGAPKTTLLMDYITMGLYALLIAVALAKFTWGFYKPSQREEKLNEK